MAKKKKRQDGISSENLLVLNTIVFSVAAILHFVRTILKIPVTIAGFELPLWFSWAVVLILAVLIWQNWIKTEKSLKVCAKIVAGILIADMIGVLGFWYYNIEAMGFTRGSYPIIAIIDAAVAAGLLWYAIKK